MVARISFVLALSALVALVVGCPKGTEGGKGATFAERGSAVQTVAEKAKVEFFVMSQCPFGLQVESGIAPVLAKMGGDIDFSLDFIGQEKDGKLTSMHGQAEVDGNKVQLCAAKYSPDKYMDMILCMNKNMRAIPGNWEACASETGVDAAKTKACYTGPEGESLLKASFEKAQQRRARGSPTMFIGNQPYRGPRSESAFARAICDAFPKDKPKLCADLPPPIKVPVTIVTDKRCKECRAEFWDARLKNMFPGAEVTILDYADEAGKKMYTDLELKLLPAILFGKEIEKADNYDRVKRFLSPKGEYLEFRSGAKFDPSKEICDNNIDDTGNGMIDCKDADCKGDQACMEKCENGKDDTGNGLVDCADPDCKDTLVCRKEKPKKLEVFVMSQCPYGVKALNAMAEVLDNFNKQIDFEVHFIANEEGDGFRALHGQPEVDENIRELCAIKNYGKDYKYMDYILCRNKNIRSTEWKACTGENGISADVIEKCFNGEGKQLLRDDIKIANGMAIGASPTWLANNRFKFQGIDAETVKTNMCTHNKNLPNCDKKLSGPPAQQGGGGGACK
jgi:hypothetical protein